MKTESIYKTPGQLVAALVSDNGWTNRLVASVLNKDETFISKLIADKVHITAELAIQLEEVFLVKAEVFLDLQKNFDLAKARYTSTPNPKRASRAKLLSDLPITEMINRGWLSVKNTKDIEEIESSISDFFGSKDSDWSEIFPHAAKKTNADDDVTPIQLAWLYKVKKIAENMVVKPYSQAKATSLLKQLKPLLIAPEEARKVPKLFTEAGIRLVFVEALKSSKIDGVCFWLSESKPVIGISLRFDRMDNFWFVLRHELEHLIKEHSKSTAHIDNDISGDTETIQQQEVEANEAASEFCVPQDKLKSFIARKSPLFPTRDFLGFCKIHGVHPCLVAGQIRFKTKRFELFNSYNEKIRQHVLPSAIYDGWGDVSPF
ncbi:transcriptional regulator [Formosimonas limnophila]|uniref:Transcriptional regulator n=1 Tax=Formosimonas limnophila TaxID=1384487 RepID=A0A8J3CM56_9BURK|nr:ImmA/IrrE family metallo-endopeptidase [Formosimonas limnophila]GHA68700.1 transcriptional regulator [Formosimonas limnophila]